MSKQLELFETIQLPECPIAGELMKTVKARADKGMETYETTLAGNPASTKEWIDHTIEELLDAANYLLRLKKNL
jgi:hypothetical protein